MCALQYLTNLQILFGDPKLDPILNRTILTTKITIFQNKTSNRIVTIDQIIATLKEQFKTEKYVANFNGKNTFFKGFWSPIWRVMDRP